MKYSGTPANLLFIICIYFCTPYLLVIHGKLIFWNMKKGTLGSCNISAQCSIYTVNWHFSKQPIKEQHTYNFFHGLIYCNFFPPFFSNKQTNLCKPSVWRKTQQINYNLHKCIMSQFFFSYLHFKNYMYSILGLWQLQR